MPVSIDIAFSRSGGAEYVRVAEYLPSGRKGTHVLRISPQAAHFPMEESGSRLAELVLVVAHACLPIHSHAMKFSGWRGVVLVPAHERHSQSKSYSGPLCTTLGRHSAQPGTCSH